MSYSSYVGRVGALAIALGVGCAVASPTGTAWADTPDSTTTSTDTGTTAAGSDTSTDQGAAAPSASHDASASQDADPENESAEESSPTAQRDEVAPGVTVSSSGGAQTSAEYEETADADEDDAPIRVAWSDRRGRPDDNAGIRDIKPDTESRVDAQTVRTDTPAGPKPDEPADDQSATATVTAAAVSADTEAISGPRTPSTITTALRAVAAPILSGIMQTLPGAPADTPLGWVLLAAARRQFGESEESMEARTITAEPVYMAAVVADQPPTVGATVFGVPVSATGAVSGQMVATDPEGQPLTYTVIAPPADGSLMFDNATAEFTYTPTTSQRIRASVTATTNDTISMTVTVFDGANNVAAVVNIPVSAATIAKLAEIGAVNDAHAVVIAGTRAYVSNRTAGTVTVIDTTTNTVVGTISVGAKPDEMVIKADGKALYVTSQDNNTVTVVNTVTGAVTTTITTPKPSAIAINSSGTTVYVTNLDAGTVTKINTSTNTVSGTISLPAGSRPTDIVVSPDKTRIYVASTNAAGQAAITLVGYLSSTSTTFTNLPSAATGLVVSPDNKRLYVSSADGKIAVIDTTTKAIVATYNVGGVLAGITVSKDGSLLTATDTLGRVSALDTESGALLKTIATRTSTTAMTVAPGTTLSPDGTRLYVTDYNADKVYVVSLAPTNAPPKLGIPTIGAPNSSTGVVTGTTGVTDADGDVLKYTVSTSTKGKLTVNANGTFTYTPTATARHNASEVNAPESVTTDSFTLSVSDGVNDAVTTTVTFDILPANKVPVPTKTVGVPSTTTGVVNGSVTATDGDWDVRTYTASTPAKGTVVVTLTGAFTYTPTDQARHAAAKVGAPATAKSDTFTITIDDGHGGVVAVSVTVAVSPANAKPTAPALTTSSTNPTSGVVTGTVKATDADNDPLTYTSTAATKGVLTMASNGTFTYTPTTAARQAAAQPGATTATKTETVTVTATDGYGGATTATLTLSISPYTAGNAAPTNGRATVNNPTSAIGAVTGTVTADDANGDALTYTLNSVPTKGLVKVDASTGAFTYVPDVDARYDAKATTGTDYDTFTVTISDGNGGSTTATVRVQVAPPAASTIDQRSTTIAVAAPDMYFYSQAELDQAFDKLQVLGVNTVRVIMPWAGIEPTNDGWRWTEADRLVNTASAHGIEVLAVLNSTPGWAVAPGTPALSGRPASPQEFAEFAGMLATQYQGRIAAYEVWNEPNGQAFWAPAPNAAQYTELLKAGYTAIKAADPNAVVVAAGLGAVVDYGSWTTNPVRFVEEMYEAGAAGYFDALAFHPYLYTKSFTGTLSTNPDSAANQAARIHDLMVANGDGNKKIWATEYGQPSAFAGDATQAAYIGDFLRAWRDLDYAGPAFIHTLRDYPNSDPNQASFGIFRQDWTPKPVWYTLEDVIAENHRLLA